MKLHQKMRVWHRYLGFFLAGIMAVYALSGIVLIFRDTDTFKKVSHIEKSLAPGLEAEALGEALEIRRFRVEKEDDSTLYFKDGSYNKVSGQAEYTLKELPFLLDKMTHLHKATSSRPLAFLNIFFGLSLLFFVISAFWMYFPGTDVFKKGLLFAGVGLLFALALVFL